MRRRTPRRVSKSRFAAVAATPKRRYQALTIGSRGRARLSVPMRAPCFWFEEHREVIDSARGHIIESQDTTITLMVDDVPSVLFYLERGVHVSCTFSFRLAPHQLASAVVAMRRAKLRRFIPVAAATALENLPDSLRPPIEGELRALIRKRGAPR
jgi:hypothetical protein